jgi:hypothetical protein
MSIRTNILLRVYIAFGLILLLSIAVIVLRGRWCCVAKYYNNNK